MLNLNTLSSNIKYYLIEKQIIDIYTLVINVSLIKFLINSSVIFMNFL